MKIIASIADMNAAVRSARADGKTVGLVPTMGFLHEGHLSLVRESRAWTDLTVVSIFVNPAQFGPNEDFAAYPRVAARDAALLEKEGADILFHPAAADIYPKGYATTVEVQGLQDRLCGASRPGLVHPGRAGGLPRRADPGHDEGRPRARDRPSW